jgi:hypothetical protein
VWFLFQVMKSARRKGGSPKGRGFSPRQAHVIRAGKAPRFAAWHHEAPITWRPNWRLPEDSLAHSVLIRFTRGCSRNVKVRPPPYKRRRTGACKGDRLLRNQLSWKELLAVLCSVFCVLVLELLFPFIVRVRELRLSPQQQVWVVVSLAW